MNLDLKDLDDRTRKLMREEVENDISGGRLYVSPRLSETGKRDYPGLLLQAIASEDEGWLAERLRTGERLSHTETRTRKGRTYVANVPHTAAETVAEGEFNRFYIRALCRRAIEEGLKLQVYRAKHVTQPRTESQARVGSFVDPELLLNDLRAHPGVETALGLPAGPNSGLSVLLVE